MGSFSIVPIGTYAASTNFHQPCATTSRFTEEQIIGILKEAEAGAKSTDLCRRLGVSEQTFYRWKRKFAGMGVAELRRLRQPEDENKRLKQLVADLTLDKQMLQEVITKKL